MMLVMKLGRLKNLWLLTQQYPVGTQRRNNVVSTSMQRNDVATKLYNRHVPARHRFSKIQNDQKHKLKVDKNAQTAK